MNYYPLRIGKQNCIVTDYPVSFNGQAPSEKDKQYYGGYLVAESVPEDLAKQLVEAYNKMHGPKSGVMDDDLQRVMFDHNKVIRDGPSYFEHYIEYMKRLDESFSRVNDYLMKKYFKNENSAHSFTEGMDIGRTNSAQELEYDRPYQERIPPRETPSPEMQMKDALDRGELPDTITDKELHVTIKGQIEWLDSISKYYSTTPGPEAIKGIKENLLAIKRWNSNPLWTQLDVEKVITDLIQCTVGLSGELSRHKVTGPDITDAIQNAEAALGMLQAFKEKRDKPAFPKNPSYWKELAMKRPLTAEEVKEMYEDQSITREEVLIELEAGLPFQSDVNHKIAEVILAAIDMYKG